MRPLCSSLICTGSSSISTISGTFTAVQSDWGWGGAAGAVVGASLNVSSTTVAAAQAQVGSGVAVGFASAGFVQGSNLTDSWCGHAPHFSAPSAQCKCLRCCFVRCVMGRL